MSTRRLVLASAALALLAGCGSGGSTPPASAPTAATPGGAATPTAAGVPSAVKARLAACPHLPAHGGAQLPDLTLSCLGEGPPVALTALTGAPTVVNLWAQWCGPCVAEAPFLEQTYRRLHPAGLRMIGVDVFDTPTKAAQFAVQHGLSYPMVAYPGKQLVLRYNPGPPVTLFVDRSGKVVHVQRGPYGSASELSADVHRYLGVSG